VLQGRNLYYYGDEIINRTLAKYGYSPIVADPDEVFSRVVRVPRSNEERFRKLGVAILLRERDSFVIKGTRKQVRELERSGYEVREVGDREPVPRRIQISVGTFADINQQIGGRVEVTAVRRTRGRGAIVIGEAFDDAIAELRAKGLKVEILPDYPGVVR
jgi:hypothetical protein